MVASSKPNKVKPPVFHSIERARGWRILRQHVSLNVDLHRRTVSGTACLSLCALNRHCCKVALNLRRCNVTSVIVNKRPAAFRVVSPLDDDSLFQLVSSESSDCRIRDIEYTVAKRAEASSRQGELLIDLPNFVSADANDALTELAEASKQQGKVNEEGEVDAPPPVPIQQLPLIHIEIEYSALDPTAGAIFYGDPQSESVRDPTYMLTESRFGMARFWMPCVDSMHWCDRYLFDFDIAVNASLMAVASGELTETMLPEDPGMLGSDVPVKVYKFRLYAPAHASEVLVAVGPFVALPDPVLPRKVTHFCLPGHASELVFTAPSLFTKALAFCRDYFGSDPPASSFKQLFVGSFGLQPASSIAGAGGIVLHSQDLLHCPRCIDEGLLAREAVVHGLVSSYFGRFLRPRSAEDAWLLLGLSAHVTALGLQAILGQNWYKFRVHDLMEELRNEMSCVLSDLNLDLVSDELLTAATNRSHVIVYMLERRVSAETLKRALRDIVAEGKKMTSSYVRSVVEALGNPVYVDFTGESLCHAKHLPSNRELSDLNESTNGTVATSGVVSTGFDEAVQGLAVGPFLKRLRAICGTDVRGMVRLWASSAGIPRMQIGYQYNARKHTIDFVVKQDEEKGNNSVVLNRKSLSFQGSISIRVMESEGSYDHAVDITEPIFVSEIPCHSRRPKARTGASDKDFLELVPRGSLVSWIRFDPENEWCKDVTFKQPESAWALLLASERDAVGQFEACQGLIGSTDEKSTKSLLNLLKDSQVYWRVRAEAARVLASTEEGLRILISYFRSCYTDDQEGDRALVRPNNFSNMPNYFVKRAMLRALAEARVKGSCTVNRPEGSVPVNAARFLCVVLAGHDNSGNDFDDDHYAVDLIQSAAKVAVSCVGDGIHVSAGDDGSCSTDSIMKQLQRFASREQMVDRKTNLVSSALAKATFDIELAKMCHLDTTQAGSVSADVRSGRWEPSRHLLDNLFALSRRDCSSDCRLTAMLGLASLYGGNLDVLQWVLTYVDRTSAGDDLQTVRTPTKDLGGSYSKYFVESPDFRYRLLDCLVCAARVKSWYKGVSPLVQALRCHNSLAIQICLRLLRVAVSEGDPRLRTAALRLSSEVWGGGIPVCFLSREMYVEVRNFARRAMMEPPKELVPLPNDFGALVVPVELTTPVVAPKSHKTKSSKGTKNGRSKSRKRSPPRPESPLVVLDAGIGSSRNSQLVEVDGPVLPPMPSQASEPVEPLIKRPNQEAESEPKAVKEMRPPLPLPKPLQTSETPKLSLTSQPCTPPQSHPRRSSYPNSAPTPQRRSSNDKNFTDSDPRSKPNRIAIPSSVPKSEPQISSADIKAPTKISRSFLRSVPVSRSIEDIKLRWHPMDPEDQRFFERAFEESKNDSPSKPLNGTAAKAKSSSVHAKRYDSSKPSAILSSKLTNPKSETRRNVRKREDWEHNESNYTGGEDQQNGFSKHEPVEMEVAERDGSGEPKKKKHKKKRKRHHDDDDGSKKKKKKRKKKQESEFDEFDDGTLPLLSSADGVASLESPKKIGKIQIKLPSRSTSEVAPAQ